MHKHWWSSLQVKIIAWSFVPTVVILSAVAWFTFYSYQKVIGDLAIRQDLTILEEKANLVGRALTSLLNPPLLPIILEIDIHHEGSLAARADQILEQAQGLEVFDGGIYFVDQGGQIIRTHPEQPELIGEDWSDTPQFRYLQEHTNSAALMDLHSLGSSGKQILCAAQAMLGQDGKAAGIGYYCFTILPATQNAWYQALQSLDLGSNVYLVDRHQLVIFSPDPAKLGQDFSGKAYLQELLGVENSSGRFRDRSEDLVASSVAMSSVPDLAAWYLVQEHSWAEIMQPSQGYRQLLLILLALGLIVPVLVSGYGVRHITIPIQQLIRATEQVTAGQFKQRIEVHTGDEIETLADQFNLMSAKLDDSYASLEKKVTDRTRELAIMNAIISVASHSLEIHEILQAALGQTVEQLGFAAGAAFKLEAPPRPPLLLAQHGIEPDAAMAFANSYAQADRDPPAVYPSEEVSFGPQALQDDRLQALFSQFGFQLLVYIPLATKGHNLGFFILGKCEPGELSAEELALLGAIGQQVGVAMENARLYEQAEEAAITAERQRLARELHDAVTQTLFSANLIADVLPRLWERSPEMGRQNLEELRQLTRGALAEMRTLLLEMRPETLERADLKSLLTQLSDAFIGRVRVPLDLEITGDCEITHEVKIVFYRVAQEALNNIAKHAGARQVELRLACQPGELHLGIQDDGLGFDPATIPPDHMGIAIMRERASSIGASLQIESVLGQGTTVELNWRAAQEEGSNANASNDPGIVSR